MSTPEAYMVLEHSLLWALDNGCIGTVLIGAPLLIQSEIREIFANTNMPFYSFPEQAQALKFCHGLIQS